MTELLERVIEQLKIFPADEQDAIAFRRNYRDVNLSCRQE